MKKKNTIIKMRGEIHRFIENNIHRLGCDYDWDRILDIAYFVESTLTWVKNDKCEWTPLSIIEEEIKKLRKGN